MRVCAHAIQDNPIFQRKRYACVHFESHKLTRKLLNLVTLGRLWFWFSALIVQFLPRDILSKTKSIQLHLERVELHLVFQISINPVMRLLLVLDHILIKFLHIYDEVLYVLCGKIWNFHLNIFIISLLQTNKWEHDHFSSVGECFEGLLQGGFMHEF